MLNRQTYTYTPQAEAAILPLFPPAIREQAARELARLRTETSDIGRGHGGFSDGVRSLLRVQSARSSRLAAFEREKLTNCSLLAGNLTRGAVV